MEREKGQQEMIKNIEILRQKKEILEILQSKLKIEKNNSHMRFMSLNDQSKKSRKLLTENRNSHNNKNNLIEMIISNHQRLKKLEEVAVEVKKGKIEKAKIFKKIEKKKIIEKLEDMSHQLSAKVRQKSKREDKIAKEIRYMIKNSKEKINESNAESILSSSLNSSRSLNTSKSFASIKRLPKRDYSLKESKSEKQFKIKKKKKNGKNKKNKEKEKKSNLFIYKKNEFVDMC